MDRDPTSSQHRFHNTVTRRTTTIFQLPNKFSAEWGSQTLRQACYRENPESAMCVQNLNDSRGLAIRITYRISLRSSSLWEPRHPPLKVVLDFFLVRGPKHTRSFKPRFQTQGSGNHSFALGHVVTTGTFSVKRARPATHTTQCACDTVLPELKIRNKNRENGPQPNRCTWCTPLSPGLQGQLFTIKKILDRCGNDPSAGSPTETLLRLHLPLNDKVRTSSRGQAPMKEPNHNPESSPDHSIGRCDGRCVQRAGT